MVLNKYQVANITGHAKEYVQFLQQTLKDEHNGKLNARFNKEVRQTRRETITECYNQFLVIKSPSDKQKVASLVMKMFAPLMERIIKFEVSEFAKKLKENEKKFYSSFKPKAKN